MHIIACFATSQSVSVKDLKMYYVLCIFPGSKKIANSMQKLDFTTYLQISSILKSWMDHSGSVSPG